MNKAMAQLAGTSSFAKVSCVCANAEAQFFCDGLEHDFSCQDDTRTDFWQSTAADAVGSMAKGNAGAESSVATESIRGHLRL